MLSLLPLPMFLQLNDILLVAKVIGETDSNQILSIKNERLGTKKTRRELPFKACRKKNRLNEILDFTRLMGLKTEF